MSRTSPERPGRSRRADREAAAPLAAKTRGYYRTLSATSVGLEMGVAVALGVLFGWWLDGQLGTSPWMLLVFLCFGFAAGMKGVFRYVREADRAAAEADAEAKADATADAGAGGAGSKEPR